MNIKHYPTKFFSLLFISLSFIFSLFYFYLMPLHWDDYLFDQESILPIYSLAEAHSPGRQASVLIHTISTQIFGPLLGQALNSPLLGIKVIHSLVSSLILLTIWLISAYYISNTKRQFYLSLFVMPPLLFLLYISSIEFTFVSQVFGGFAFALITMIPIIEYFKNKEISWFDTRYYGLWIALLFMGTQITEGGSLPVAGFSILAITFIRYTKDEKGYKLLHFLFLYIALFLFSIFRTSITGGQQNRVLQLNFSLQYIYKMLFRGSLFHDITIIVGILITIAYGVYFLDKFIKSLSTEYNWENDKTGILIFFLMLSSISSIILLIIQQAFYVDQALWILWIAELMFIINISTKFPQITLIIPTGILALWVLSAKSFIEDNRHRPDRTSLFMIQSKKDWFYVQRFIDADKNNANSISFTADEVKKYDLALAFNKEGVLAYPPISEFMYKYGYTKKVIPIIRKSNQNLK
ncbi:MAG: hypothetical protein ACRCS8_05405 [Brevinema sp.]